MTDLQRSTHPTVHEVVVGDRTLPIVDRRALPRLVGRLHRRLETIMVRRRAIAALTTMFAPRGIRGHRGLDATTTLAELEIHERGATAVATVHMSLWTGRRVRLAMYEPDGEGRSYAIGHLQGDRWLWTDQLRTRWLSDETAPDGRLTERLLAPVDAS